MVVFRTKFKILDGIGFQHRYLLLGFYSRSRQLYDGYLHNLSRAVLTEFPPSCTQLIIDFFCFYLHFKRIKIQFIVYVETVTLLSFKCQYSYVMMKTAGGRI